jgi:hypothetical protein
MSPVISTSVRMKGRRRVKESFLSLLQTIETWIVYVQRARQNIYMPLNGVLK